MEDFSTWKLTNARPNCNISSLIIAQPPAKRFKITLIVKRFQQWSRAPSNIVPLLFFIMKPSESYKTGNVTNIIHQFYFIFDGTDESTKLRKGLKLHYFTAVHSLSIRNKQHASQLLTSNISICGRCQYRLNSLRNETIKISENTNPLAT